ncbi:hypothetical protein NDU88_004680 [Pleurodeles waltl]|uniref:Uncharacterized protein n=1 Tax=Pleurodeles waltl TaxID=8319 RepID=A0AAV7M858_PLEWA|nr:hypothetical protein NDU88_004680 [Pleurodeles waltl]
MSPARGAWPGSGTWRTPRVSAPEGPAAKLRANAPTRAARARSPSAVQLTSGRSGWAPAADPTCAVDHAEPSGPRGGLRPLLSLKAAALLWASGKGARATTGAEEPLEKRMVPRAGGAAGPRLRRTPQCGWWGEPR